MRPASSQIAGRRRFTGFLVAAVLGLPLAGALSSALEKSGLEFTGSAGPVAFRFVEKSPENVPIPVQPPGPDASRYSLVRSLDRVQVGSTIHELTHNLLHHAEASPVPGSKLDFCPEFTKPDSLKIRLMGTPKNHRSPPA